MSSELCDKIECSCNENTWNIFSEENVKFNKFHAPECAIQHTVGRPKAT